MCRIVLFIFLAINLCAEEATKPASPVQKELVDSPNSKDFLSSSNKELQNHIIQLVESNPYKVLENAVLSHDPSIKEALKNYQAPTIKVFSTDIYFRTLILTWLKETQPQAQENTLQQNTWLLEKDSLDLVITKLQALEEKNKNKIWNFRLNYALSLVYEAKSDFNKSLEAINQAYTKHQDQNSRFLLRRRMVICSARAGNFASYERFINETYNEEKTNPLMNYEKLHDQLALKLLQGNDTKTLLKQIIEHPNADLARSIQSLVLTGQHQEAYLLNPKANLLFPFLLELNQFSLAKKLLPQVQDPQKSYYYLKVLGILPKELQVISKHVNEATQVSQISWLLNNNYHKEDYYSKLYQISLNSTNANTTFLALANLTKSNSAAELYLYLNNRLPKKDALNFACLLSYTKNSNSFLSYIVKIQQKLRLQGPDLDQFINICASLALDNNLPDAALGSLKVIDDKNQHIQHIITGSIALLRKKEYLGAAHNGLIRHEMKIPELMEIATFALNQKGSFEKAQKADQITESYYVNLAHLNKTAFYFNKIKQRDLLEQVYWRLQARPLVFNKDCIMLINAASSYFLQKEDHLTWAKFAELKVAYALLQPSKINTPAQALALRKDLLRLQLIKAINKGQEKRIIHFAKIWTSEFTMDIEPVLILHKYQLPYSAKLLQLKTDLFNDRWSKLSKHITQHPKASIQLNEIAWMGASCFQNLDKASDYAERAYNCSKQAAHLDTWAQCLYATGKINKAVELLQECVKLEPNVSYFSQKLTLWKNHLSAQE
jgi:hypothetical protein